MIGFKDFPPQQTQVGGIFARAKYGPLSASVEAANRWITAYSSSLRILNVETVVLPYLFSGPDDGTQLTEFSAGGATATWHQVVRVWYEAPEGADLP